jgi:hypothetical protein
VAAVRGGLLGSRLEQARLQGQQLLRVLDRQRGLGVRGGFGHRRLGDLEVELDQLLDAFERRVGQVEQGLDVGLLGAHDLFNGDHLGLLDGTGGPFSLATCCSATWTECSKVQGRIASAFCCAAANLVRRLKG